MTSGLSARANQVLVLVFQLEVVVQQLNESPERRVITPHRSTRLFMCFSFHHYITVLWVALSITPTCTFCYILHLIMVHSIVSTV